VAGHFKSYFMRGLAVLIPSIVSIGAFVWCFKFIQENISIHINKGLVLITLLIKRVDWNNETVWKAAWLEQAEFWIKGSGSLAGLFIALILVFVVGVLLASVVGKTLWRIIERFIMNTPMLRRIYPYVKQVTDFVLTQEEQKTMFSRVVAVEYPRKGIWSMGMVTGSGIRKIVDKVEKEFLTVLIPTSPTPFTGFAIMVPKEQTIDLDMTVEEAFRFAISGGVIAPDQERTALPTVEAKNKENVETDLTET